MSTGFILELLKQGIALAVAGIALFVAYRFYKDMKEMRIAHEKERKDWETRYVTKVETQLEKYHDLAKSLHAVIEALERRMDKR